MADFNVNVKNVENSSGFLGASRGASAPVQRKFVESAGSVVDLSGAIKSKGAADNVLLDAAGSLYTTALNATDSIIKSNIEEIATIETDQIFNEFGADDTTLIKGTTPEKEPAPSEIDSAAKNLERLSTAQRRGVVDENTYWARMETVSRQLRARYPGHRDYIDQKISSIAGGKPANQIVQNLMAQAAKGSNSALEQEKNRREFIEKLTIEGMYTPELEQMEYSQLLAYSGPLFSRRQALTQQRTELDVLGTVDKVQGERATKLAQTSVQIGLAQTVKNVASPLGKDFETLNRQIIEASKSDKPLDADTQEKLRADFGRLKMTAMASLQSDLIDNYQTTLTKQQREEVLAPAKEFFDMLEQGLVDPKSGLFMRTINRLEAYEKQDLNKLMDVPGMRMAQAVTKVIGPQNSALVLQNNATLRTAIDKVLVSDIFDQSFDGKGPAIADRIRYAASANELDPKVPKTLMNNFIQVLNNPTSTPEAVTKAAQAMYRMDNTFLSNDIVPVNEQPAVFTRLVNSSTYDKLKEVGGQPVEDYRNWAKGNFLNVFRRYADDLKGVDAGLVTFDAKAGEFKVAAEVAATGGRGGASPDAARNLAIRDAAAKVTVLNTGLRAINPILKDQNIDPVEFLRTNYGGLFKTQRMNLIGGPIVDDIPGVVVIDAQTGASTNPEGNRMKPGDVRYGKQQMTPEQGDGMELEEISNLITRKQQDLRLFKALQEDGDPEAIDGVDRTLRELEDLYVERDSLTGTWLNEFKRRNEELKKKRTPTS